MHQVRLFIVWEKMLPSDMNKILISDSKFNLGKNDKVNALVLGAMPSHKVIAQPTHADELAQKPTITHEEEKIALILFITGGFAMWFMFR